MLIIYFKIFFYKKYKNIIIIIYKDLYFTNLINQLIKTRIKS